MKGKTEAIRKHLEEKGSVTTWEAIQLYGATRLSAIIYNLRHKYEMNIKGERVEFTDRFNNKATYCKYILIEEKNNEI